ncbi:MAG: hypothetical protein ACK56I_30845, partial [bacterium]
MAKREDRVRDLEGELATIENDKNDAVRSAEARLSELQERVEGLMKQASSSSMREVREAREALSREHEKKMSELQSEWESERVSLLSRIS